ncbi:phytoene desaturase family protein [Clostridium sp. B9]|uniref:phytoene desaturase family protein n=1 Tax=Clostridium sp. B9 TaxID=3423224 RepID=UPI003D2EBCBB
MKKKAIIIGAGIGGLATAIRLLSKGFQVEIFEKNKFVGGKVNIISYKDFKIDSSASIFMMPKPYLDLFKDINKNPKDYFKLIELKTLYRVFSENNVYFDIYSDFLRTTNSIEKLFNEDSSNYYKYISESYRRYLLIDKYFLNRNFLKLNDVLNPNTITSLFKIHPFKNCYKTIEKYIKNEYLRIFLGFQCMYIGESPLKSSNVFNLIPSASQVYGLYYIKGGMYSYIKTLEKLFFELGGKMHLSSEVTSILMKEKKAIGISCNHKYSYSDLVICNCDFSYAIKSLIPRKLSPKRYTKKNIAKLNYSCSTFILHLFLNKRYSNLDVHNIILNKNKEESLLAPFISHSLPKEFIYYIYCPSTIDRSLVPNGCECMNIILRVPNLNKCKYKWNHIQIKGLRDKTLYNISRIKGLEDIKEHIIHEKYTTPLDFKNDYNCFFGSSFGLNHNLLQTTAFRPQITQKNLKSLYFVGDSIHPGAGISMVLISSRLCANKIIKDFK